MTPEQEREFNKLSKKVEKLENLVGFEFVQDVDLADSAVRQDTAIGGMGGTVTHNDYPDRGVVVRIKGKPYLLLAYELADSGGNSRITS